MACWVVRADYRGAPQYRRSQQAVRRVWISKYDELILRDYWEGVLSPGVDAKLTETTNYIAVETDVALPDDLFVFQPPPNSKLGEPRVMGGMPSGLAPPPPSASQPLMSEHVRRIEVSESVQQAKLLRHPEPVYPPSALQARIQGLVKFEAIIGKDGTMRNLRVISGHPMLVRAALDAVKQRLYEPTVIDGEQVEVATQIEVPFSLP